MNGVGRIDSIHTANSVLLLAFDKDQLVKPIEWYDEWGPFLLVVAGIAIAILLSKLIGGMIYKIIRKEDN